MIAHYFQQKHHWPYFEASDLHDTNTKLACFRDTVSKVLPSTKPCAIWCPIGHPNRYVIRHPTGPSNAVLHNHHTLFIY